MMHLLQNAESLLFHVASVSKKGELLLFSDGLATKANAIDHIRRHLRESFTTCDHVKFQDDTLDPAQVFEVWETGKLLLTTGIAVRHRVVLPLRKQELGIRKA